MSETTVPHGLFEPSNGEAGANWRGPVTANFQKINDRLNDVGINVMAPSYGALGTGTGDDGPAWNSAIASCLATGAPLVVPARNASGTQAIYRLTTQVVLPGNIEVFAKGAKIITSGAISGLELTGSRNVIHGLTIDQTGNASMTAGFDAHGTASQGGGLHRFDSCQVSGASPFATDFSGWRVRNDPATPSDDSSGSYWNQLVACGTGLTSGTTKFPFGVLLEGGANRTVVGETCSLFKCVVGVGIRNQSGDTSNTLPNSVRIHAAFETITTAVHVAGAAASVIVGPEISGARFEDIGTVLSLTGVTAQPSVAPLLFHNQYAGAPATAYINNPNALNVNALDPSATPDLGVASMWLFTATNPLQTHKLDILNKLRVMDGAFEVGSIANTGDYMTHVAANGHKFTGWMGFNGQAPTAIPVVTGSRGGNAALASLLTGLAARGLITDSSTA